MNLKKATEADSEKLKTYFSAQPLPGPMEIYIDRHGSFFDKYKLYSKDYVTYFLEDEDGEIHGLASMIFSPGYINGQREILGYATDLRISNSRKAVLNWSQHFLPILEEERQKRQCRFVFSVVSRSQKMAINAFLRPRSNRRQLPRYHLYRKFSVIGIHGRLPWAPRILPGLHNRSATKEDLPRIHGFLSQRGNGLEFPHLSGPADLEHQLDSWIGFQFADLKLVENSHGELLGTYALWNPLAIESFRAQSYSGVTLTLQQALRFFRWTGTTRPFAPAGNPLRFRYLTHLRASTPDVFESILTMVWNSTLKEEFVLYPHYEGDLTHSPPKSFITSESKSGLYCLQAPSDTYPDFFHRSFEENSPYWELSFM